MASSRKSRRSDLAERVRGVVRRHVAPGARLTLALSGGVDSIVALDILARLAPAHPFELDCLHVDHGISSNARAWAKFARAAARRYGLRCTVRRADLAPYRALGLEGAARAARYAIFARARADYVVLAQHADDQAETVLLQLVRGAGLAGLAGMPPVRPLKAGRARVLRPLLDATRAEIEAYAREHALEWVQDESNADERLARNLIRRRVMPLLRELNPQAVANLARSATHLAEAHALLSGVGASDAQAATVDGRLSVPMLAALGRPRAKNALRAWLAASGIGPPDTQRTEEMLEQLLAARADANMCIQVDDTWELRRFRESVWLVPRRAPPPSDLRVEWNGARVWRIPELGGALHFRRATGAGLARAAVAHGSVAVRARQGGERFQPDAKRPRRALKALLQEADVPPWERARLPLLYCGRKLAYVPGIGIAAGLQARAGAPGVRVTWHPDTPNSGG
jgi:tRNA(Ile)-lysidine synthase